MIYAVYRPLLYTLIDEYVRDRTERVRMMLLEAGAGVSVRILDREGF